MSQLCYVATCGSQTYLNIPISRQGRSQPSPTPVATRFCEGRALGDVTSGPPLPPQRVVPAHCEVLFRFGFEFLIFLDSPHFSEFSRIFMSFPEFSEFFRIFFKFSWIFPNFPGRLIISGGVIQIEKTKRKKQFWPWGLFILLFSNACLSLIFIQKKTHPGPRGKFYKF